MFKVYSLDQREKWINIINSFDNIDIYYHPDYVIAYKKNNEGEPLLIHYNNNGIELINVVIKRDISKHINFNKILGEGLYYDFITPYGYGGMLFKEDYVFDLKKEIINEYLNFCKNLNIISEFIRFNPLLENYKDLEKIINVTELGPTVSIDTTDLEKTWNSFSSKNRNIIRKSIKNGVEIYSGKSNELLNYFVNLYYETMKRDNANEYYYFSNDYFQSLLNDLNHSMQIFYALYEKKIISMSTVIFNKNYIHYHLSASDYEYRSLGPTNLLLWEVAKYASNNGIKKFHLGGGLGGKMDNLYKFKKSFNKENDLVYKVGKIIFNYDIYNDLCKKIMIDSNDSYFPLYRKV